MSLTITKLKALEKKATRIHRKEDTGSIIIPHNWVDFARLTRIRSAGEIVHFEPYDYQKELIEVLLGRSVCVVKSRQLGISETITSFMLWRAASNPGYLGVVFSKGQADTSLLARRMRRMIDSIGLKTLTDNLQDIELESGGRILFKNSRPESARSIESVVDAFFDEASFTDNFKEIFDALAPAQQMLGEKARSIVVSTPNDKNGLYWDLLSQGNGDRDVEVLCSKVSKGEEKPFQWWIDSGGWAKILIHWKTHPIYGGNPNFLEDVHQKQKLPYSTIRREYDLSFADSEVSVFGADIVRDCAIGAFEKPREDEVYFIGIDTSTVGQDFTVGVVIRQTENGYSLVSTYRKRQESSEFHMFRLGEEIESYLPLAVAIEVTGGTGQIYLEQLSQRYPSIRFEAIRTTGDSKPAMIDRLKLFLEKGQFIFPSKSPLVDELLSFKRAGKKLEAGHGKHDDVLMACCFALTVAERAKSEWDLSDVPRLKKND